MNNTYFLKLEFNKVLEKLSTFCHTYVGKSLVNDLLPSNQKEYVEKILNET